MPVSQEIPEARANNLVVVGADPSALLRAGSGTLQVLDRVL
jgi:hypothetical protein